MAENRQNVTRTYEKLTHKGNPVLVGAAERDRLGRVIDRNYLTSASLKTVNGETLVGSGNLAIKTYMPVPGTWTIDSTTSALITDIKNDASAVKGMAYLDTISCTDLPAGLLQGEAIIEVISGTTASNKIILIRLNSADVEPYNWEYNSYAGVWREMGGSAYTAGEGIDIVNNEISVSDEILEALPEGETDVVFNPVSTTGATEIPLVGVLIGTDYYKAPTVDQVYNSASANAQSGTAVAEAIAAAITTTLNTPM